MYFAPLEYPERFTGRPPDQPHGRRTVRRPACPTRSVVPHAHPLLLNNSAPAELASLHGRQEVGLHLAARELAATRARGEVLSASAEARLIVATYLGHLHGTEGRDAQAPQTEDQLLVQIRAAAAEVRLAYIDLMCMDPLVVDDDLALLVALTDADLHSLIDHQEAMGQLLVVRERIYGQPEAAPGEMGD